MKNKRVFVNNRKRSFALETDKGTFQFPYSQLRVKPLPNDPIKNVYVDTELACEGFSCTLKPRKED